MMPYPRVRSAVKIMGSPQGKIPVFGADYVDMIHTTRKRNENTGMS